ncbi:hypothetical protein OO015_07345 [Thermomicrobium sp. 4228-Ro]|uniref:hypothetical protein n=1 Tax=Thermomicrobium sp. 4228-Ro TaxID=2993937 RepID=UPI002248F3D4|nr:hypothetical protein [Thermomicrobium sp. 4228-Ro]MCX2727312.1 hypothetical protein [Thermomicrobium sp. 4228-Ro]
MEGRHAAPASDDLDLPFPIERLRGRIVFCTDCGSPLAVFRRRRFYALQAEVLETTQGGVLVCRQCGKQYAVRELLATDRRARHR